MEKHTKCRMEVNQRAPGQYELTGEGTCIEVAVIEWIEKHDEEAAANARRLAACWNACEGIPTAELKDAGPGFWGRFAARNGRQRDEAKAENDRLRAALQAIHEAGRMSDQTRAMYCADIAEAALNHTAPEAAE